MSNLELSLSGGQRSLSTEGAESGLDRRLIAGLALLALGAAMFALGIFHGFRNGSCSTTGYTGHYGPVQHCGKGVGWWMLMLMAGLLVVAAGVALAGTAQAVAIPVLFTAIGVPFVALALRSGDSHLLIGRSSSSGKLSAGIFGACFVIAGVVWGAFAARRAFSGLGGGSLLGGLLGALAGVGVAFAIAAGVAGAIGSSTAVSTQPLTHGSSSASSAAAIRSANHATSRANAAITQATTQAGEAEKLAACVTAAGTSTVRIQRCERKYTP